MIFYTEQNICPDFGPFTSKFLSPNSFFNFFGLFRWVQFNQLVFGQSVFGFRKNTLRTTTCEILRKILRAVLEISDRLQIMIFVSKFKIFFSKSPNGSIRKVNWLESIFQHFLKILPITGHPEPRLRFFFNKKWNRSFRSFYQVWNLGSTSYCILW